MPFITFTQKGDFNKTEKFLKKAKNAEFYKHMQQYGELGVQALSEATPIRTGKTASSWAYDIELTRNSAQITWSNTNTNQGENIAILIQYGHGTGTGGYVHGQDYVNPAMRAVFDKIIEEIWKEVTEL